MGTFAKASILPRMPEPLTQFLILSLLPVTALLAAVINRNARRLQMLDVPGERSAHAVPTPRGGGLSIVISVTGLMVWLYLRQHLTMTQFMLWMGALPVAVAGLVDDWRGLDYRWRILVQLCSAVWVVAWLDAFPVIPMPGPDLDAGALWWLILPPALVWLCNLYNFMDGIDGLATVQCCFVALAVMLLQWQSSAAINPLAAGLGVSAAGFLFWNRPPARIFLGDVGSTWLGFMLGILALLTIIEGSIPVWSWLLLMGVFLADTTVTLCVRVLSGARWHQAHASHAYQHLARRWGSHGRVLAAVTAINGLWLAPLAWFASQYPQYGVFLAVFGIVPLLLLARGLGAGKNHL